MKNIIKLAPVLMILASLAAAPSVSQAGPHRCTVVKSIGQVHVREANFATKIRRLRAKCRRARDRYEEAQLQWEGGGIYSCNVGSFCRNRFRY